MIARRSTPAEKHLPAPVRTIGPRMPRTVATASSTSPRSKAFTGALSIQTMVTPSANSTCILGYLPQLCLCLLYRRCRLAACLLARVIGVLGCGQGIFGVPQSSARIVAAQSRGGEIGLQLGQRRVDVGLRAFCDGQCRPRHRASVVALRLVGLWLLGLWLLGRLLAAGGLARPGENHRRVAEFAEAGPLLGLGQPA